MNETERAAVKIQSAFRSKRARKEVNARRAERQRLNDEAREAKLKAEEEKRQKELAQKRREEEAALRKKLADMEFQKRDQAATKIQRIWHGKKSRNIVGVLREKKRQEQHKKEVEA